MNEQTKLIQFAAELIQEVINNSEAGQDNEDGEGDSFREDEFTRLMIEYLTDAGELDDGEVCYHRNRGIKVNGYSINQDFECLNLFISIYTQSIPPVTVTKQEVETAFRRLTNFLQKALKGYHLSIEEASSVFDMALQIHDLRTQLSQIRLYLFTDGRTTIDVKQHETIENITCSFHVWDIERTYRCLSSGKQRETIEIDFESQYGVAIPCLPMPRSNSDYTAYMVIIPGEILYKIYAEYGPRLLERNVRSFLQARGKVNKGIRQTILQEPHRFLAYNNGISATAEAVELVDLPGGGKGIKSARDLQIVNGGQTTVSIYQAAKKDKADVSNIYVQAKLSVVAPEKANEIVPLISRYANNQNKVNEADFSANDPFHIQIEEFSRTIWAPAVDGTQRQTRWFYERTRGQYLDVKGREGTAAKKKIFTTTHPTSQKFTKTDLAKFENTWNQLPHLVSLGAEKNFREFTIQLAKRGKFQPDEDYFKRLIAKAILFRKTEKIVQVQQFGGYRANIVTYTLAYLSNKTAQQIDLERIWREQGLSPALQEAIKIVSYQVHQVIINPPGGRNVTEWCKKEECWKQIQTIEIELPNEFWNELISVDTKPNQIDKGIESPDTEDLKVIVQINEVSDETWFQLAHWAKETDNLHSWQRSLAFSLGKLAAKRKSPSYKQANEGIKILHEAEQLGFKYTHDSNGKISV
ncbi:AIPR family protein [Brasilonema bromeliae]|uniref:Abortive phage infection protein n=1 Tax=Brasilonema bromeliae SPC951 TaxID=385972 RepID=A0ABX1PA91_9CYAN|nr:AIPR family protein [Brasilonema bromeliae]NMG20918.1 abortive phage infection protein [Brasilonema bromeliae SPC951]